MRRTIPFLCCVMLLLAIAPAALADQPEKGCPADASVWTQVDYVTSGNFKATGFYEWYWGVGDGAAIVPWTGWSDEEIYFFFANGSFPTIVDRNADLNVCVSWLGANPGVPDQDISIVDNNSATQQ